MRELPPSTVVLLAGAWSLAGASHALLDAMIDGGLASPLIRVAALAVRKGSKWIERFPWISGQRRQMISR